MTSVIAALPTATNAPASPRMGRRAGPNLWVWGVLAAGVATALAVFARGRGLAPDFIDSDDALRLIHVRELLAGAPWYETTTRALGGEGGLVSHWSRLLDGPMALLLGMFRLAMTPEMADKALLTCWPFITLTAMFWAIGRCTAAARDEPAALTALALSALGLIGYYQFAPGRIDHHNVMIAATIAAGLMIWAWPKDTGVWRWAGALCGLALAVGYEALAPVAAIAGLVAGWALLDRSQSKEAASYVEGLLAALVLAFVLTVPPSRWFTISCDTLALNLIAAGALAGGSFIALMRWGGDWSKSKQAALLATGAAVGAAVFARMEPACLGGPLGQLPAELGPIWIANVEEARSLFADVLRSNFATPFVPLSILAAGLAATVAAFAKSGRPADRFLLILSVAFVVLAGWQMKYTAYASFLLVAGTAAAISTLPRIGSISPLVVRVLALLLLNQFALFSVATSLRTAAASTQIAADDTAKASGIAAANTCVQQHVLQELAVLPPGLVVAHNDIGTYIATATHHRVLSGPYHRIPHAIIANHAIWSARDPDIAGREIARLRADYIVSCVALDRQLAAQPAWQGTFLASLTDRPDAVWRQPDYLVRVPFAAGSRLRVWRVESSRLPQP